MERTPHGLYLWSTALLFVVGTLHVVFFAHNLVREMTFIYTALKTGDDTAMWKYVTNDNLQTADESINGLLAVIANFLADLMLVTLNFDPSLTQTDGTHSLKVHRCYMVWSCNKRIGILFVLTCLINSVASAVVTTIGLADTTRRGMQIYFYGVHLKEAYNGAHAAANLLVTTLTASRIWWCSREARESLGTGPRRLYRRITAIILESGTLYPIVSFVNLALRESASEIGIPIDLSGAVTLVAGIAPTLMIVRCRVFNTIQNHTMREAGALSTLQFNPNAGTETTPDEIPSQVRDIEAQTESSGATDDLNGEANLHDEEKGANIHFSSLGRVL
ncbi:hypothetical protein PQX77_021728 [Marasmius sp. AFHP31]|nr:hypothetical protein PQX77_021728 [Marasmius sp. AFHP31]